MTWLMTPGLGEQLPSLEDLIKRPAWMSQGSCKGEDLDLFFPRRGVTPATMARAREVCAGCPVRTECLEYADADAEIMGVWGGTTERDRRTRRHVA